MESVMLLPKVLPEVKPQIGAMILPDYGMPPIKGFNQAALLFHRPQVSYDGTNAEAADRVIFEMVDITGKYTKVAKFEYTYNSHVTSNAEYLMADSNIYTNRPGTPINAAGVLQQSVMGPMYYTSPLFGEIMTDAATNTNLVFRALPGWLITNVATEKATLFDVTFTEAYTAEWLVEPTGYKQFVYQCPDYPNGINLIDGTYLTVTIKNAVEQFTRKVVYDTSVGASMTGDIYPLGAANPGEGMCCGSDGEELSIGIELDRIMGTSYYGDSVFNTYRRAVLQTGLDSQGLVTVDVVEEGWVIVSASVNAGHGSIASLT